MSCYLYSRMFASHSALTIPYRKSQPNLKTLVLPLASLLPWCFSVHFLASKQGTHRPQIFIHIFHVPILGSRSEPRFSEDHGRFPSEIGHIQSEQQPVFLFRILEVLRNTNIGPPVLLVKKAPPCSWLRHEAELTLAALAW